MKVKITWEESGDRDIHSFKKVAIGKDYFQYSELFSERELLEFLNFQQNRKIPNKIKILEIEFVHNV